MRIEEGKFYRTRAGQRVGPMQGTVIIWVKGHARSDDKEWTPDGTVRIGKSPDDDLVALWTDEPAGPVRTVTRKEIVEGAYGRVRVLPLSGASDKHVGVRFTSENAPLASLDASELRAAAATLIELADALEDGN